MLILQIFHDLIRVLYDYDDPLNNYKQREECILYTISLR